MGYDAASMGDQIFMPSSSRVDLETEDTMLLQNTGVQLSSNAATYPRVMRSSATLLQKPQNSR